MTIDEHIHKAEDDAMMAVFDTEWGIGNYFIDRTEALEYAKECRQLVEWLKDYKRLKEQEPSGDLISREAVLDTISELNAISFYEAQEDSKECYYELRQAIENLSPVKQEPKTGHWEWVSYDYNPKLGDWHCSECRCVVVECVDKNEKGGIPLYKYCPQCGTKMLEP